MELEIPQQAARTVATLSQTHSRVKVVPKGVEHLAYEMAIPDTWRAATDIGPVPAAPLEARSIGLFASANEDGTPVIGVTVTAVPYEIPLDAWAKLLFASEDWAVVRASWFPGPSNLFYDITGVREVNGVSSIRRCAVSVSGTDILVVNCQCEQEQWDDAKEDFWVAMVTFEVAVKSVSQMEPWVRGKAHEPSFVFAHPGSWLHETVESSESNISAVDVRLPDADGTTLLAYLQVRAQRVFGQSPTLNELEARALARLESSGFVPSATARQLFQEDDPRSIAVDGWLGAFTGPGMLGGVEVVALRGHIVRAGVEITVSTLAPPQRVNPLLELRSQRAFEIARKTLSLV